MVADVFGLVGQTLDNTFRIERVVGEGGFAVVYQGRHLAFEIPIAVKCLKVPPHFTAEGKTLFMDRFRAEGKLLARLGEHINIVRVYHFGVSRRQDVDVPYLVMDWLTGSDLEQVLAGRTQTGSVYGEQEAIRLIMPVVSALAFAHSLNIAHCDVKPAKLFLAQGLKPAETRMKVLDFGIAKAMQEGERITQIATRTSSGFRAFSPDYGAPEQFFSKRFGTTGPWTDVHALGLVLTALVTGRPPLDGEDHAEWLVSATNAVRPTPRTRGTVVSNEFESVLANALALDPRDRFSSATELESALQALLPGEAASPIARTEAFLPSTSVGTGTEIARPVSSDLSQKQVNTELKEGRPVVAIPPGPKQVPSQQGIARLVMGLLVVGLLVVLGATVVNRETSGPPRSEPQTSPSEAITGTMVRIPGGTFTMGSMDGDADEQPVVRVTVKPFEMDETEVTVAAYAECVKSGTCTAADTGDFCNYGKNDKADHPINCVDADDAETFCRWAGNKRLPSEEEWEYAARGTDGRKYPWGNEEPSRQLCWAPTSGRTGTCPVKRFPAGVFGLFDMSGNVWEWTASGYSENYGARRSTGRRVFRGGCWGHGHPADVRSSFRSGGDPSIRSSDVGFRCAR